MKYTVITGASSGIGYEAALAFAGKNKNLIIVARSKEKLEQLEKEIKKISPDSDVIIKVSDLSVSENVYKLYDDLKEQQNESMEILCGDNVEPVSDRVKEESLSSYAGHLIR